MTTKLKKKVTIKLDSDVLSNELTSESPQQLKSRYLYSVDDDEILEEYDLRSILLRENSVVLNTV